MYSLDACDYGVPQHRKRVFVIGFRDPKHAAHFTPPATSHAHVTVGDALHSLGPPDGRRGHALHTATFREIAPKHTASRWDQPSKTIVAGTHGVGTGTNGIRLPNGRKRHYTPREAARLQTFPDSFVLPSRHCLALKQLGNACPPLLAKVWARAVAKALSASE